MWGIELAMSIKSDQIRDVIIIWKMDQEKRSNSTLGKAQSTLGKAQSTLGKGQFDFQNHPVFRAVGKEAQATLVRAEGTHRLTAYFRPDLFEFKQNREVYCRNKPSQFYVCKDCSTRSDTHIC